MSFATAIDMNNDGKLDLFLQYSVSSMGMTVQAGQLAYLPGDGAGHFGSAIPLYVPVACGGGGSACTTGPQCCSRTCKTHPLPDGGIMGMCTPSGSTSNGYSYAIVTDLNQDKIPDVAAIGGSGSSYALSTVLSGGGTWAAPTTVSLPAGTYVLEGIAAGNLRNSTDVDLAIATQGDGLLLLPGNGTGSYAAPTTPWLGFGLNVLNIGVADLDVDGHPDLIGTSYGATSTLEIQWGDGTLSPSSSPYAVNTTPVASPCPVGSGGCGGPCPVPFSIGDVTGDGKPDLNAGLATMAVAVNGANRTFAQPVGLWELNAGSASPTMNANLLVDVNGDGKSDVVAGGGFGGPTLVLVNLSNHFSW